MAAFFARLQIAEVGERTTSRCMPSARRTPARCCSLVPPRGQTPGKEVTQSSRSSCTATRLAEPPVPEGYKEPKVEGNKPLPPPTFSRKDQLVEWITKADNPYFARASSPIAPGGNTSAVALCIRSIT